VELTTAPSVERALRGSRLFAGLAPDALAPLAHAAARKRFARGEVICRAGEAARSVAIITSGLVKVCQAAPAGETVILGIFGPRETVGDFGLDPSGTYEVDAVAASPRLEVLSLDRAALLEVMGRDVRVALALNRSLAEQAAALREKIRIMTAGAAEQRLATLLLHLAGRFGDEAEDGSLVLPVALSRSELARLVGSTVETAIRVMSRWQKAGVLETSNEGFVIFRPVELERLVEPHPAMH
jgi:CRP-like cAMP-binding protein